MRVCQPGPVAFQRLMTSAGSLIEINCRGFAERGRPPLLTTARSSISSVNSGSSRYSDALIRCVSTLARSEPKVRREARFFPVICFPHAEYVAYRATRRVSDHNQSASQFSEADDPLLAIVPTRVLDLHGRPCKDKWRIFKVEPPVPQRPLTFSRIVGNAHLVIVYTETQSHKYQTEPLKGVKPNFQIDGLDAWTLSRSAARIAPCEVDYPTPPGDLPGGGFGSISPGQKRTTLARANRWLTS